MDSNEVAKGAMDVIFLDRDGVINKDPGGWTEHDYVTRWEDFRFLPGAKEALRRLAEAGYKIIIISNQAGVHKGFFTERDLNYITENMLKEISSSGGSIYSVRYCPHTKDEGCGCRKPAAGLIDGAAKELGINSKDAFFVGDGSVDVEAGKRAGCRTVLVLCGKSALKDVKTWRYKPDCIKKDLLETADWILSKRD